MVMTSPYHTESSTYRELEESRSALIIPAEVTNAQVQEERFTATEDPAEVSVPDVRRAFWPEQYGAFWQSTTGCLGQE